jgi:hypothetical protein
LNFGQLTTWTIVPAGKQAIMRFNPAAALSIRLLLNWRPPAKQHRDVFGLPTTALFYE